MVSSPMAVSPRETKVVWHRWRGLVCASWLFGALLGAVALAEEPRFFRIGTAATGGSFFEIGGLVARAISKPAGGPAFLPPAGPPARGAGGGRPRRSPAAPARAHAPPALA